MNNTGKIFLVKIIKNEYNMFILYEAFCMILSKNMKLDYLLIKIALKLGIGITRLVKAILFN